MAEEIPEQDKRPTLKPSSEKKMWDLAQYVEDHPEKHNQRWRLAKKLYAAWEYRLALEHLQVLNNEWEPKLNVLRYMAATQYRLARYEEAVSSLTAGIETWPDDVSIREQLARVFEMGDRRLEAIKTWKQVLKLDPHHPIAESAAKQLSEEQEKSRTNDLRLVDSDSGIDLSTGQVCPNCGAQNSDAFDRCWLCMAPLSGQSGPLGTPQNKERTTPLVSEEQARFVAGVIVVAMLAISVWLSMGLLGGGDTDGNSSGILRSFEDVYNQELGVTRVITGAVLILFWPLAFWLTLVFFDTKDPIPTDWILLFGLLLGVITFLGSWLPFKSMPNIPIIDGIIAFAVIKGMLKYDWIRGLCVWVTLFTLVITVTLFTIVIVEYRQIGSFYNPLTEFSAIQAFSKEQQLSNTLGSYTVPQYTLPIAQYVTWQSTGSKWLDVRGNNIEFFVKSEIENTPFTFEIKDAVGSTRVFERTTANRFSTLHSVHIGDKYEIIVAGEDGLRVQVTVVGLAHPLFEGDLPPTEKQPQIEP